MNFAIFMYPNLNIICVEQGLRRFGYFTHFYFRKSEVKGVSINMDN